MDKVAALVIASDDIAYLLAKRVKSSFSYFHPDIPVHIFTLDDEEEIFGNVIYPKKSGHIGCFSIRCLEHLKKDNDLVIKLDADVVVTGKMNEFLEKDYDVACSLNEPGIPGIDYVRFPDYCNLGVTAVRSMDFAKEWREKCYDDKFVGEQNFIYFEQDVMNYLAFSGKYKTLLVDKEGVYYNEQSKPYWDRLRVKCKELFIDDRPVKALHWAGGGEIGTKFNHPAFSNEVRSFLNRVTDTHDFKPREE